MTYELICERRAPEVRISGPAEVFPLVKRFATKRQEHFLVLTVDGGQKVIRVHITSIGLLNRTLIHPREVFVRAIKDSAASIILCHNHPSGSLDPSREDREATERLVKAGDLLGIQVLDHLIVSKHGFVSFQEMGVMPHSSSYR